ncbi:TadE/TadG family type IV pilus assembly protein [Novosphingobium sp. M1R2S20]|uniref:TadE/TadG family type IV pilus assembly protein n=1 Tax=Novosphingobium rhizovicinum TaxID=3228928 RepID=A0ABV3RBZ0_9SPHN
MIRLGSLSKDRRGTSAVEFALLAPTLLMAMLGLLDLGYNMYTATILEGSIQKAARDSTLEGASGNLAAIDERVREAVHAIAPRATIPPPRRTAYSSFSAAGKPEDYTDTNGNGRCDTGEPFEDANENGRWDTDRGSAGSGSARDVVLYEVTVTYPRPFPIGKFLGMGETYTMSARTVLGNQPWDNVRKTPPVERCT